MIIILNRDETVYLRDGEAILIPAGNEVKIVFEKEQLRKYLDREFTPNNPMYMCFLEHV